MYHIKEAAQLSGVSVKTLHHYDKIGLLVPLKSENGYRTYSQEDLERLQVILYYKYLGFSLEKIAELLKEDRSDLLPTMSKLRQNKIGGVFFRFFYYRVFNHNAGFPPPSRYRGQK